MISIKVLGPGCANCQNLERLCREVVSENNIEATVEKVTDIKKFVDYGLLMTPGLVINEKLVSSGNIPVKSQILKWLDDV